MPFYSLPSQDLRKYDASIFSARKAKNVGDAEASARLFNTAGRKKRKSEFTNFGLSDYK
jgi:hypothetical protein